MKIVVLDGYTVNPGDLDWQPILDLGDVDLYDRSLPTEIVPRSLGAEVILVNKVRIGEEEMSELPDLKGICMLATGYDNVDIEEARNNGISVYNAVGYGSESVAQHAMALMLAFANRVESHHRSVQQGDWSVQDDFSYTLHSVSELKGKTLGIFGYGKIGRRLGEMALVFGMHVLGHARNAITDSNVESVDQEELFRRSDFLSLHAPLTEQTKEVVNARTLASMKRSAVLINTGRGGLVNEQDLIESVTTGQIAGAGLDVLQKEPPRDKNPVLHIKDILVTPHMAWRSREARRALIAIAAENISRVKSGSKENRII
ncbi:MAG: D-2-hydroxyacid dehydrogenase [Saprospiraceae bacterium]|nr:D-2-hydroxyacid dehydrogenase [Saprospiraceae bacterium]